MKGIYVLIISVNRNRRIKIGSLGNVNFEKGTYAYVGSAQKNLEKRLERHLRSAKKTFWHIDYLLTSSETCVQRIFVNEAGKKNECRLAEMLSKKGRPVLKFGSSGCRCKSHLFSIKGYEFLRENMQEMAVRFI